MTSAIACIFFLPEFALFKGHRYACVVLDDDTRRVLWIGEGRRRAAVSPFLEELGAEGCTRIEAVAIDMNAAFDLRCANTALRHAWPITFFMWPPSMVER